MELAPRLSRLWAAMIDRLVFLPIPIGAAIIFPGLRHSGHQGAAVAVSLAALAAVLAVQVWLLTTQGQTIGKKALGLRIVKVTDMTNGGFVTNVLLRAVVNMALTAIPVLGVFYLLADALFIFRDDRRCIHDFIAGTCVIKA